MIVFACFLIGCFILCMSTTQQKDNYKRIKVQLERIAYTQIASKTFSEIHDTLRKFYDLMRKQNLTDHELQDMLGLIIETDRKFESILLDSWQPKSANEKLIRKVSSHIQELMYEDVSKIYRYHPLMPHVFADKWSSFASYH